MGGWKILSSWKARIAAIVAAAVVVAIAAFVLWARAGDPARILAERRGPNGALTRDQTRRLLAIVRAEWRRFNTFHRIGDPLKKKLKDYPAIQSASLSVLEAFLPRRGAETRLIYEGRSAELPISALLADETEGAANIPTACYELQTMNPYAALQLACRLANGDDIDAAKANCIWNLIIGCLPDANKPLPRGHKAAEWLKSELGSKTLDEVILESLDRYIADRRLSACDSVVLHWLNRCYGMDYDEWLAQTAPDALAFRNRELARGFDPAQFMVRDPWIIEYQTDRLNEENLRALFPEEADRAAIRVFPRRARWQQKERPPEEGWREKLLEWYKANRANFVYDTAKRRFVVRTPSAKATGPRVESTP